MLGLRCQGISPRYRSWSTCIHALWLEMERIPLCSALQADLTTVGKPVSFTEARRMPGHAEPRVSLFATPTRRLRVGHITVVSRTRRFPAPLKMFCLTGLLRVALWLVPVFAIDSHLLETQRKTLNHYGSSITRNPALWSNMSAILNRSGERMLFARQSCETGYGNILFQHSHVVSMERKTD